MNRRTHIVIVDDGVNPLFSNMNLCMDLELSNGVVQNRNYANTTDMLAYSHGSICALIIQKYAPDSIVSSIKILNESMKCYILSLRIALEYCINIQADIVNLSLGSIHVDDKNVVFDVTEELSRKTIIVGAISNSLKYTIPASFNSVIGVSSLKQQNKIVSTMNIVNGCDAVAPSVHGVYIFSKQFITPFSNSFATPYVSSILSAHAHRLDKVNVYAARRFLQKNYCQG